ncbi:MAG: nucleotidyl transferase AbiEii/AbiGii toxin family protein [Chloroflexi bacterium]|nr:nucleotidyl transferase AbiEii/AbiGii toxin family protein [Chloroflexota bacterium]
MEQTRNDISSTLEVAEAFHLAFLGALVAVAKPDMWALKGGGNLRFYFDSIRFSEDIDLDVHVPVAQMRPRIERAFESAALAKLLASVGSKVDHLNPKERTATKERWTIGLRNRRSANLVYTQVEISYREYGLQAYIAIEAPRSAPALSYPPIPAPTIAYYVPRGALIQKVTALADRRHTQPRDVFDIDHLARKFPDAPSKGLVERATVDAAIDRALELGFELYRSKVVSFLEPSVRGGFDHEAHWTDMQLRVVDVLERMRSS